MIGRIKLPILKTPILKQLDDEPHQTRLANAHQRLRGSHSGVLALLDRPIWSEKAAIHDVLGDASRFGQHPHLTPSLPQLLTHSANKTPPLLGQATAR
jgi:hypothetical protein